MKNKIAYLFGVSIIVLSFLSCGSGVPKSNTVKLKNESDSLNYFFGLYNAHRLISGMPLDEETKDKQISEYIEGLNSGLKNEATGNDNVDHLVGDFGGWLKQQTTNGLFNDSTLKFNYSLIRQGMINGSKKDKMQMTVEEAMDYINKTMMARQEKIQLEKYKEEKEAGEKFIAEAKTEEGAQVTESGLIYIVQKEGSGVKPTDTNKVKVNYVGTLMNGEEFDSSYSRNEPAEFEVNRVIPGWTEGLQLMPVGSKYKFIIPQELAYGAQGTPNGIPPFAPLVFEVELLEIVE